MTWPFGVGGLPGRCLRDIDRPAGDEGGEEPKPVRARRNRRRSRPGQDGVDEFAEGAHDIRDRRRGPRTMADSNGAAQAQSFGDEAAGEDQHPGGGHLAQR